MAELNLKPSEAPKGPNFGTPIKKMCGECGKPYMAQPGGMSGASVTCPDCIARSHRDWIEPPKAGGKPAAKK